MSLSKVGDQFAHIPDLSLSGCQTLERDPLSAPWILYQGRLLEASKVKDDEDFDQWASRKRDAYRSFYVESYQKIIGRF